MKGGGKIRYAIIACRVFGRELSALVATCESTCAVYWLEQGLHNTPELLREQLQTQIDRIDEIQQDEWILKKFDAILICYGLCSNGVVGISSKTLPLVLPRCDDCIALFLGSQERYLKLFHERSGIYWYNPGWVEIGSVPSEEQYALLVKKYSEQYGEDNAEYLVDIEKNSLKSYSAAYYVRPSAYDHPRFARQAQESAAIFGWEYVELDGSTSYLSALINGCWDEKSFLVCPVNKAVELSHDEKKIK